MPRLKADKIREMATDEILKQRDDFQNQLFKLGFQQATGQIENAQQLRNVRRDLARVLTVLREREGQE